MEAQITVIAKPEVIDSVSSFSYRWCINSGLSRKEATGFALALDELITNVILFAYPDEKGTFEVTFRNSMFNVEVILIETGEPFDPDLHKYDSSKAVREGDFEGAGLELVRHFTDTFLFLNRGKQGKEFRISKTIDEPHIKELKPDLKTEPKDATSAEQNYKTDIFKPSDAEAISKLIYRTYDYSYTKEDMYFPKKVERGIAQKKKIGVITRDEKGEAVGYFAIIKKEDSNIAEVGEAVVSPAHRRRGVMTRMMERLIKIAKNQGMLGLFGTAIASHPISQKVNHKFGFVSTALMLAKSDPLRMKSLQENTPQPTSIVLDFLPLRPFRRPKLYLPAPYRELLLKIYGSLNVEIETGEGETDFLDNESEIDVKINYNDHFALILIESYGHDFEEVFHDLSESLKNKKLNAVYVDLPLDQSGTPHFLDVIRDEGYLFSGITPLFHNERDYLRMQKIYADMDFDLIEVFSELAKEIKTLVSREYHAGNT